MFFSPNALQKGSRFKGFGFQRFRRRPIVVRFVVTSVHEAFASVRECRACVVVRHPRSWPFGHSACRSDDSYEDEARGKETERERERASSCPAAEEEKKKKKREREGRSFRGPGRKGGRKDGKGF